MLLNRDCTVLNWPMESSLSSTRSSDIVEWGMNYRSQFTVESSLKHCKGFTHSCVSKSVIQNYTTTFRLKEYLICKSCGQRQQFNCSAIQCKGVPVFKPRKIWRKKLIMNRNKNNTQFIKPMIFEKETVHE